MKVQASIKEYINSLPEAKGKDLQKLHDIILELKPDARLWFLDGRNADGKVVSNPNIGYGLRTIKYADGSSKEFYQVGVSANTTGISVYIMGIEDRTYLTKTYGNKIGKASVTGYCIKFKGLKDIDLEVLRKAMEDGF
jgi:Domain of unknown function (DU1801)